MNNTTITFKKWIHNCYVEFRYSYAGSKHGSLCFLC